MYTSTCLGCHLEIKGRADKKFCSPSCRTNYHNRVNRDANRFMRTVNRILRKNRKILANFNPDGKTSIHRNRLVEMGFNFRYYTNTFTTQKGNRYHFCYEYGYLALENDRMALVIRQSYVE